MSGTCVAHGGEKLRRIGLGSRESVFECQSKRRRRSLRCALPGG